MSLRMRPTCAAEGTQKANQRRASDVQPRNVVSASWKLAVGCFQQPTIRLIQEQVLGLEIPGITNVFACCQATDSMETLNLDVARRASELERDSPRSICAKRLFWSDSAVRQTDVATRRNLLRDARGRETSENLVAASSSIAFRSWPRRLLPESQRIVVSSSDFHILDRFEKQVSAPRSWTVTTAA